MLSKRDVKTCRNLYWHHDLCSRVNLYSRKRWWYGRKFWVIKAISVYMMGTLVVKRLITLLCCDNETPQGGRFHSSRCWWWHFSCFQTTILFCNKRSQDSVIGDAMCCYILSGGMFGIRFNFNINCEFTFLRKKH